MATWTRSLLRVAGAAAAAPVALCAGQMYYVRAKFKLPPDASGPLTGVASIGPQKTKRRRNIVFLGDSIVTGVGCSVEASREHGPILPRRVAQLIAETIGEDVGWTALGETGADVRMMSARLLPSLQNETQRVRAIGERVDAVVILTGLNDIKECFLFAQPHTHHPWRFGSLLASLLGSICDVADEPSAVLVAGTPVDAVPRFNKLWPLSAAMSGVCGVWENQKRVAAEAAQTARALLRQQEGQAAGPVIQFLEPPPGMINTLLDGANYFAEDGMHPNDAGYAVWADIIATRLLKSFEEEGRAQAQLEARS